MRRKVATHFSHKHPLRESKAKEEDAIPCSICEQNIAGAAYKCDETICNNTFIIHQTCFELIPKEIPSGPHHPHLLTLLTSPGDHADEFTCNACGDSGTSFNYNCSVCKYNVHVKCACCFPPTVTSPFHEHEISLCFSMVCTEKDTKLVCDVCDVVIRDGLWVYSCSVCDFGAHINCLAKKSQQHEKSQPESSNAQASVSSMESILAAQARMMETNYQRQKMRDMAKSMHRLGKLG